MARPSAHFESAPQASETIRTDTVPIDVDKEAFEQTRMGLQEHIDWLRARAARTIGDV